MTPQRFRSCSSFTKQILDTKLRNYEKCRHFCGKGIQRKLRDRITNQVGLSPWQLYQSIYWLLSPHWELPPQRQTHPLVHVQWFKRSARGSLQGCRQSYQPSQQDIFHSRQNSAYSKRSECIQTHSVWPGSPCSSGRSCDHRRQYLWICGYDEAWKLGICCRFLWGWKV